jgi:hypothetical protein
VWGKAEKREHEVGNTFRGFGLGAKGQGRRTAARRGIKALARENGRKRGERTASDPSTRRSSGSGRG